MNKWTWTWFKEEGNYSYLPNYYDAGTELFHLGILDDCGSISECPVRHHIAHAYHPDMWPA